MEESIRHLTHKLIASIFVTLIVSGSLLAQQASTPTSPQMPAIQSNDKRETTQQDNEKLAVLAKQRKSSNVSSPVGDYLIGPEDLLEINILEATDLNRTVRVSDDGAVSLALLGLIQVAGMTTRELELVLEDRLRQTYMKDPQVAVFVQEIRSHPVSVLGAVSKPGVYQIRFPKPLIEVLSMAEGLATDAGDTVIVEHHVGDPAVAGFAAVSDLKSEATTGSPAGVASKSNRSTPQVSDPESVIIHLEELLDSSNAHSNVLVYPGDSVKVARAGVVYVLGQVRKPGGFLLKTNQNISVLQAIALAEGTTPNSNGKNARIFLAAGSSEERKEIAINLDKIMAGKEPSPWLKPNDVLFVPNSGGKEALHVLEQSATGIVGAVGGAAVYRW
jgi:polysaccharide biosynthesis/export protein